MLDYLNSFFATTGNAANVVADKITGLFTAAPVAAICNIQPNAAFDGICQADIACQPAILNAAANAASSNLETAIKVGGAVGLAVAGVGGGVAYTRGKNTDKKSLNVLDRALSAAQYGVVKGTAIEGILNTLATTPKDKAIFDMIRCLPVATLGKLAKEGTAHNEIRIWARDGSKDALQAYFAKNYKDVQIDWTKPEQSFGESEKAVAIEAGKNTLKK